MEEKSKNSYGIFSMIAMVIGIVIGSGIFIKNQTLIETNGSTVTSLIAWVIGSILVFTMIIAFMELFDITRDRGEQSTCANLSKLFYKEKTATVIGFYFSYINLPGTLACFAVFGTEEILTFLREVGVEGLQIWSAFILRMVFLFVILAYFFFINGKYSKPGKYFQNVGTAIKLIPLLFTIILFGCLLFDAEELNNIFDPNLLQDASIEYVDNSNPGILLIATMPAILFVFDGFIISGSLSKEGKTENTYKWSVLIGITITIVIYLLFTMSVYALGDVNEAGLGTIPNAIDKQLPGVSSWLSPTLTLMIIISMLTATSGTIIGAAYSISDMSSNNLIADVQGKTMQRNKNYALPSATKVVLFVSLMHITIFTIFDLMSVPFTTNGWTSTYDANSVIDFGTDYYSNIVSALAFLVLTFILMGGILNRFTNKLEIQHKSKLFLPTAIFSSTLMLAITILFIVQLLWFDTSKANSIDYIVQYIIQILIIITVLSQCAAFTLYHHYKVSKVDPKDLKQKQKIIDEWKLHNT